MGSKKAIGRVERGSFGAPAISRHFSTIAPKYNEVRITDPEVVDLMVSSLPVAGTVTAADVGCGTGRYMLELMDRLGDRIFAHFIDCSEPMLDRLSKDLEMRGHSNFDVLAAQAESLPVLADSLDCMLAFNAIHHFQPAGFLHEVRRTLRPGGALFVYTRFRNQNGRSIWGQHFPGFDEKEKRLYEEEQLIALINATAALSVRDVTNLSFERAASLDQLLERVRSKHYSTFCLYGAEELERATEGFQANIAEAFGDSDSVEWVDENVMIIVDRA